MIKNKVALEVKVGERVYAFICDNDSPLGELFDAVCQLRGLVIARIKEQEEEKSESK